MDTTLKAVSSYQQDQDILDSRGIPMTVEEVAGLSTTRYAERVQSLRLNDDDCAFLKGLRRRIKNRLASQNSRRRSVENLRRLTRELRVVRACKGDAVTERHALLEQRRTMLERCRRLREHVETILKERSDPSRIPNIDVIIPKTNKKQVKTEKNESLKKLANITKTEPMIVEKIEYNIDKLVENSVNFMYKNEMNDSKMECEVENLKLDEPKIAGNTRKVAARTIFFDDIVNNSSDFVNGTKISKTEFQNSKTYPELTRRITAKTVVLNGFESTDLKDNETNFQPLELTPKCKISELTKRITAKTIPLNGYNTKLTQNESKLLIEPKNGTKFDFEPKNGTKLDFEPRNGTKYNTLDLSKKVIAKTVFLNGDIDIQEDNFMHGDHTEDENINGVLNLSVKNGRRHHGRKQSAPRKIAYAFCENEDAALDLQVKE